MDDASSVNGPLYTGLGRLVQGCSSYIDKYLTPELRRLLFNSSIQPF